MDQADSELKETISHIWPLQAKKMIDLLVPRTDELNVGKLSVGKIYGGLLILESWRNTKFGQLETDGQVSSMMICCEQLSTSSTVSMMLSHKQFAVSEIFLPKIFHFSHSIEDYFYKLVNQKRKKSWVQFFWKRGRNNVACYCSTFGTLRIPIGKILFELFELLNERNMHKLTIDELSIQGFKTPF